MNRWRGIDAPQGAAPGSIALQDADRAWTFAELRDAVRGMADALAGRGIRAGDRVAVHAARGAGLVVSLLALGEIDAIYVPVNARLPQAQASRVLASLGCAAILVEGDAAHPIDCGVVLAIDQLLDRGTQEARLASQPTASGDPVGPWKLPAYVIHTSGSTGKSKAVLVGSDSLRRHVAAIITAFDLGVSDRVLQVCSPAFDVSIEEILPTLVAGARLVFAPDPAEVGMQAFSEHLDATGITVANLPTALWCSWIDHMVATPCGPPASLRLCIIGGESCPPVRVSAWRALAHGVRCLNAYGLTETTITNCYWEMVSRAGYDAPVPIGHPLGDNRLHVLDESMRQVPRGTTGELHIGGPWLAHGYLGDPALTADRYRPDPFSPRPGDRLFRTGDRAFVDDDDAIVVVGRMDRQVKLHGYRLEPGEIEAAILTHPAITYCHVAAVGTGEHRMLAAIAQVAQDVDCDMESMQDRSTPGLASALSQILHRRVADYALPSCYRFVRELPYTTTGKVDTAALVEDCMPDVAPPGDADVDSGDGRPRSAEACVQHVLGRRPDLSRGFYEAGGDSVLALRLVAVLRQAGYVLALKDLMSGKPLAVVLSTILPVEPADAVDASPSKRGKFIVGVRLDRSELAQLHANQHAWRDTEFICAATPMQMQMLELSMHHPRSGNCIEQVEGTLHGIDIERFRQSWEAVSRRHESMRSYFNLRFPGRPLQVCRKHVSLDWQVLDWSGLDPATQAAHLEELLKADRYRDFRLLDTPLTRWQLIRLDADSIHLVWTYHHALLDGWSDVMILREVFEHYRSGDAARLPAAGSYRDYVHWLSDRDTASSLQYWRQSLAMLDDRRGWLLSPKFPPQTPAASGIVKFGTRLGQATTRMLRAHARQLNVPVSALVVAAFGSALMDAGSEDLAVFGQFVWVRPPELGDLDRTAGMFVNLVPVAVRRLPGRSAGDLARDLLRQQLDREAHLYLASDAIAATAPPSSEGPLLDAAIVFENYPDDGDTAVAALRSHAQSTIPLTCYVWPGDDMLLEVGYDRARLSESAAAIVLETFAGMLARIATAADVAVDASPL